jgi:hypothetical protein
MDLSNSVFDYNKYLPSNHRRIQTRNGNKLDGFIAQRIIMFNNETGKLL